MTAMKTARRRASQRVCGTRRGAPCREALLFVSCGGDNKFGYNKTIMEVIRYGCVWTNLFIPPVILLRRTFSQCLYLMLKRTSCQM
jgi:hypothetical protein